MRTEHNSGTEKANATGAKNFAWSKMHDDTKSIYHHITLLNSIEPKSVEHATKYIVCKSENEKRYSPQCQKSKSSVKEVQRIKIPKKDGKIKNRMQRLLG